MMDVNVDLLQWFKMFWQKFCSGNYLGGDIKSETMSNQILTEALHKPIIRKFKKRKV